MVRRLLAIPATEFAKPVCAEHAQGGGSLVLREILALLVNGQATIGLVAQALGLLIPFVLVFALPMGMLTATLLVFGRFSADQELTAVRASGVSLVALVTPVLLLSAGLSCVSAMVNLQVAPQCRVAYKNLFFRLGLERASSFIVENQFMDDFPGYVVYIRKKDGTHLQEVSIYKLSAEGKLEQSIQAASAKIISYVASNQVVLLLYKLHRYDLVNSQTDYLQEEPLTLEYKPPPAPTLSTNLSDMTFSQLWQKLRDLERLSVQNKPIKIERASAEELREQKRRLAVMTADLTMPVRVQIHRQVAFSFAYIGYTLI